ncbi:MAG: extracellular solute-binding protein [Longibaculum muris]|uniref:Carbohydrate ABC transporter substrate-binding protein (CUT1 family) n=1 Tax=Longibaculum muris TaxID=1796628 RepID=A0A4R3YVM9_9FIRM|nr:extracellular solute-binding protein [Longibaculum muris]KXU52064.1 ABC transporter, solute-binding protein [Candidatus Stoquefichus sp. KLE1796]MCR1888836.1 extracellular solute-binding protein [Longibaculum muris]MED9813426.1 extracellular solute-binding protein [Longibaculum muris]TCV95283.1 carbohydrate ABC transporter substrate-binding protein (CUT1 family) [Longibaculum muris]
MNKKAIIVLLCIGLIFLLICWPHKVVIKLGIFAGSNWDVPSGDSYYVIDHAIERFEKKHKNVEIEYQSGILKEDYSAWLSQQILKGEEPDVFMILSEDFNTLSSLGALKDLHGFMKQDHQFDTSLYYQSVLQAGIFQKKQYALPYESNPTLMFVNKTLLKKEGISIPDNDWSLDDFYRICQKVTKDSNHDGIIDQYGYYNYDWLDSIYGHGGQLFNEDGTMCYLNQQSVKDSLVFLQKLTALNQGYRVSAEQFDKGQVAFSPMPLSQYRTYKPYPWRVKKYSQFEWDCVKMPSLSNQQGHSQISTLLMGLSSRSQHEQLAWEFLKTLTYDQQTQTELIEYSQGISSLKTVSESKHTLDILKEEAGDSQVNLSLLKDVMENAMNHNQFKKYESALNLLTTHIQQIIDNNADIDTSLIDLQKQMNQYLKD